MDFLPIILLFAISVTGLALTVSQEWLRGAAYSFLAILHAITVIAALLFLPFGKFFHIFQRPAQLGVKLYQEAGAAGRRARTARAAASGSPRRCTSTTCARCCRKLGFDYAMPGPGRTLAGAVSGLQAQVALQRAAENQGGLHVAKAPGFAGRAEQPVRAASELHAAGRLAGRIRASRRNSW